MTGKVIYISRLHRIIVPERVNTEEFSSVFLVLDYVKYDFKKFMDKFQMDTVYKLSDLHLKVIMYNTLCAINFIHSAGVMHRDIKPHNLLISENSEVKICDFGLSRASYE